MPRKPKPDWTEVMVHVPKKRRGFWCYPWSSSSRTGDRVYPHYVKTGDVWACDQCRRVYICGEHWQEHMNEHAIQQLARQNYEGPL